MRVTSKGQVTIPQELRRKYGLEADTDVEFVEEEGRVWVRRVETKQPRTRFSRLRGIADAGLSTDQILALTREREATPEEVADSKIDKR